MGHPPEEVWACTPRELKGWLVFAQIRRKREYAELLELHTLASRGDPKSVKKQVGELSKE